MRDPIVSKEVGPDGVTRWGAAAEPWRNATPAPPTIPKPEPEEDEGAPTLPAPGDGPKPSPRPR